MRRIRLKTVLKNTVAKKGMGIHRGVAAKRANRRKGKK